MSLTKIKSSKVYFWSPTSAELFLDCPRQWYFQKKIKGEIRADMAFGSFVHNRIEQLRINRMLGKRVYKSAESWANACSGWWKRFYCPHKDGEEKRFDRDIIKWESKSQPWIFATVAKEICLDHFDRLMTEPLPMIFRRVTKGGKVIYTTECDCQFVISGRGYRTKIDEVRPDMVLRDYKTGKWSYSYHQRNVDYKLQPTFYILAFCVKCREDPEFRDQAGVSQETAQNWAGNPIFISDQVKFDYYILQKEPEEKEGKKVVIKRDPIITTFRNDNHYQKLCQKIDWLEVERIWMGQGNSYPAQEGSHCKFCLFKKQCEQMTIDLPKQPTQLGLFSKKEEVRMIADSVQSFTQSDEQLKIDFPKQRRTRKESKR